MAAAEAVDDAGIAAYFAKAKDQGLARKIMAGLLASLAKHRRQEMARWFREEAQALEAAERQAAGLDT